MDVVKQAVEGVEQFDAGQLVLDQRLDLLQARNLLRELLSTHLSFKGSYRA